MFANYKTYINVLDSRLTEETVFPKAFREVLLANKPHIYL